MTPTIQPKKLAINYNPPTLILKYSSTSASSQNPTLRTLKLFLDGFLQKQVEEYDDIMDPKDIIDNMVHKIAGKVYVQFKDYYRNVAMDRIREMVEKLVRNWMSQRHNKGTDASSPSNDTTNQADLTSMDAVRDINLNALDDDQLEQAKMTMDVEFELNRLRPGDPGYQHDVTEEFGEPVEDSGWDSD